MNAATEFETVSVLNFQKEIHIAAPIDLAFEAVLEDVGAGCQVKDGAPMPMVLEARPGGRWFRDLGSDAGHLWGWVQVIKPPTLLELTGPMFMSYACSNHIQYRLTPDGMGTKLQFTHRGIGQIPREHREGVAEGWGFLLERIRTLAESRA